MGVPTVKDDKLNNCNTVEEVEKLCCYNCANNHHFGWCDVEAIVCPAKSRIKAITGKHGHSITLEEHINKILERNKL